MKQLSFLILLLIISLNCLAASKQANTMTNQSTGIKAMLACMHRISNADIKKMKKAANAASSKVAGLCKEGKHKEAVKVARAYIIKRKNDPATIQINRCAALAGAQAGNRHNQTDAKKITVDNVCGRKPSGNLKMR